MEKLPMMFALAVCSLFAAMTIVYGDLIDNDDFGTNPFENNFLRWNLMFDKLQKRGDVTGFPKGWAFGPERNRFFNWNYLSRRLPNAKRIMSAQPAAFQDFNPFSGYYQLHRGWNGQFGKKRSQD
ncbi:uncharacterized protein [Argopecten irradians]|uniref:uncharacterized protein n=1 Tax=Argopecten irradians TaxID=31199 RepID=UPI00371E5C2D